MQWLLTNFTRVLQPITSNLNWTITFNRPDFLTSSTILHLTLKITSAQVVETSVIKNSSQNYTVNWTITLYDMLILLGSTHLLYFYKRLLQGEKHGAGFYYLITWNFRDTLISRFWGSHISKHLSFAILRKFYSLIHFNFALFSETIYFLGNFMLKKKKALWLK